MLTFDFTRPKGRGLQILCVGAHSDDIEIGCGGAILRLLTEYGDTEVHWVVLGSSGTRDEEAARSAEQLLARAAKKHVAIEHFRNGCFPYVGAHIKAFLETPKLAGATESVHTHYRHDLHHDPRVVPELTSNTLRSNLILEYEILKYDGDLGTTNVFVHLDEALAHEKIRVIMDCFKTQQDKDWFTPDAFLSLL